MDKSKEIKIRKAVSLISDVCQQQLIGQQRVQTLISELIMILNECFGEEHTNEILHALTDSGDGYFQPRELVFTLKFSLIAKKALSKKVKFAFNMIKCIFKEFKRESKLHQIEGPRNAIKSTFSSPEFIANEARVDDCKSIDLPLKKDNETDTIVRCTDYSKKRTKEIAEALKNKNEKLVKEKTFLYWRNKMMINEYKSLASLNNCIKIFKRGLGKHFGRFLIGGKSHARSKNFLSRLIKKSEIKNCKSPFKIWKKEKTHTRNMSASSILQHTPSEKWSLYTARKILAGLEQTIFYFAFEKPFKIIIGTYEDGLIEMAEKVPTVSSKKPPMHKKLRSGNPAKEENIDETIGVITPSFKTSQMQNTQNKQVSDFGGSSIESSITKLSFSQLTSISIFGLAKSDEDLSKTILSFNPENESSRLMCDESSFNLFGETSINEVEDLLDKSACEINEKEADESPKKEFVFWTDYVRVLSPVKNKAKLRNQAQAESIGKDSLQLEFDKIEKNSSDTKNEEIIMLDIPKKAGSFSERNREKRKLRSQAQERQKIESIDESPIKPANFNEVENFTPSGEESWLGDSMIDLTAQNQISKKNSQLCKDNEGNKFEVLPLAFRDKNLDNIILEKPKRIEAASQNEINGGSNILNSKVPIIRITGPINCCEISINNEEKERLNKKEISHLNSLKPKSFTPSKELHPKDSIESFKTDVSSSVTESAGQQILSINNHTDDDSYSYLNHSYFSLQHQSSIEIKSEIAWKNKQIDDFIKAILSCHRICTQRLTFSILKDFTDNKKSHVNYLINCLFETLILNALEAQKIRNQKVPYSYKSLSIVSLDSEEPMSEKDFVTAILLKDDPYYDEKELFKKRSANVLALASHKAIKRAKLQNSFNSIILYSLKRKKYTQKLTLMTKIIQEKISSINSYIFSILLGIRSEFHSKDNNYTKLTFKNSHKGHEVKRYKAIDNKFVFSFTNKVETMLELALFKQKYMSFKCIQEESLMSTRHNKQKHKYGAKACLTILTEILKPKCKKIIKDSFESIKNNKFSIKHKHNSRPKINVKAAIALYTKLLKISQNRSLNNKKKSFRKIYSYSKTLERVYKLFKFTDLLASAIEKSNNKLIYSSFHRIHDKSERERIYKYVKVDYLFKKAFIRRLANAFVAWISNLERQKELDITVSLQRESGSKTDYSWRSCYSSYSTTPITCRTGKSDLSAKKRGVLLPVPKTIHDYIDDFNEVAGKKVDASYFSSPVPNPDRLRI
ncbi:unnamed protein product [Blepharisma stoltei]|uniref:Uncharacterized protein n=1 Tax=Blepharisma stoltei TaxID=1481888 RepID=A0AAU9IPH8_9CILI|nr:unnamed protein product [Blepharisma stoltei]